MKQKPFRRFFHMTQPPASALAIMRVVALGAVLGAAAWAQEGEAYVSEFSTYAGVAFGQLSSHFTIGGAAGGSVDRYLVILLESGYTPLGSNTLVNHAGYVTRSSGLYDFDLAFHVRIPLKHRWEPYGIAAPALLYNRFQRQILQTNGVFTYRSGVSDVKFGFETGAGLRYYIHPRWGVRSEFKYTISTHNYSRFMMGMFRQF
jgi:opacity protein-like surface antigen